MGSNNAIEVNLLTEIFRTSSIQVPWLLHFLPQYFADSRLAAARGFRQTVQHRSSRIVSPGKRYDQSLSITQSNIYKYSK